MWAGRVKWVDCRGWRKAEVEGKRIVFEGRLEPDEYFESLCGFVSDSGTF